MPKRVSSAYSPYELATHQIHTCLQHLSCQRDFSQSISANNIHDFSCLHASYHHELYKAITIIYSRVHATTSTATTLGMGGWRMTRPCQLPFNFIQLQRTSLLLPSIFQRLIYSKSCITLFCNSWASTTISIVLSHQLHPTRWKV